MDLIATVAEHVGSQPEKFYKTTLFRGDQLLLGLNCLEPGQVQQAHEHGNQDKFYYIVEGSGRFRLGLEYATASAGQVVWAPAGLVHGVENISDTRLTMLVGIAPAP